MNILGVPIIQDEFIILIVTNKLEYDAIQKLQDVPLYLYNVYGRRGL